MKTITQTFPMYTAAFWPAYMVQMRPYLLFISGVAGLAGIAMTADANTPSWKIFTAFLPFFFGYGFGQALTDCFQTDTDKLSAPYRPLSKGIISIRAVCSVSLAGLVISGIILYLLHPLNTWLCLLSVAGLATYSFIKKNYCFAGPFYNAWIVGLLPVMGSLSVLPSDRSLPAEFFHTIVITFFSYASFVLMGYLKDIDADKATGYKTFPVVFGWNLTVMLGDLFAIITLSLFWILKEKNMVESGFGLAGSLILIAGQVMAHTSRHKNEKNALFPILSTVRSFILLHMAIILHYQEHWAIALLVLYIFFEITLYLRPSRYQV